MARKFTFRLDSDGVEALKAQLTALGTGGEQAFAKIQQASPQLANALQLATDKADAARAKLSQLGTASADNVPIMGRYGSAIQQAGFQVGDFAVQVASGQSAMRAFIQQGSQLLGFFGPWGAVIGAGVAVVGALVTSLDLFGTSAEAASKDTETFEATQKRLAAAVEATSGKLGQATRDIGAFRIALAAFTEAETQKALFDERGALADLEAKLAAVNIDPERTARSEELTREVAQLTAEIAAQRAAVAAAEERTAVAAIRHRDALLLVAASEKEVEEAKKKTTAETRRTVAAARDLAAQEAAAARAAEERFESVMRGRIQFSRALVRMADDDSDKIVKSSQRAAAGVRQAYAESFGDIFGIGDAVFSQLFGGSIRDAGQAAQAISALFGQAFSFAGRGSAGGNFSGSGTISGLGGLSGFGFGLGGYLFGTGGNPVPGTVGPPTAAQAGGLTGAGSPLLGNLTGGLFGGLQYLPDILQGLNASGPGQTYGQLGGGIGGAVGSLLGSFFGPVGSMIGGQLLGQLGSLVGSFFAAPNNYPKAAGYLGTSGGLINLAGTGADNKGGGLVGQAKSLTETAIAQINAIAASLGGAFGSGGLGYFGPGGIGGFQVKAGTFNTVVGGKVESFGQDQAAAIQNFIVEVIAQSVRGGLLAGVSGNVQKALGGTTDYDTLAELTRDINLGRLADGLGALSENAIAFQAELIKLQGEFEATKKRAAELGFAIEGDLQKQFDASKQAIEEKYFGQFRQFAAGLQLGPLSVLSPQAQFEQAQTTYRDLQQRALAGDALAQSQFIGAAQTYLTLARQQFASSPAYVDIFNQVLASTQRLGSPDMMAPVVGAVQASGAAIVAAIEKTNERLLRIESAFADDRAYRRAGGR